MAEHEFTYDPALPFIAVGEVSGKLYARFAERSDAVAWCARGLTYSVIDTTPPPLIPADARFITWTGGVARYYARRHGDQWLTDRGAAYTDAELVAAHGSDFTILDVREES